MPMRAIPLLVALLLLALLWIGLGLNPRELPSPLIGKPTPSFSLPLLQGEGQFTDSSLQGQVSVLNVWASWCSTCRSEHRHLKTLQAAGLAVYGLNYRDEPDEAQHYLRQLGNPYRMVGWDGDGRVGIEWGVYATPETFIIDRHGIVRFKHIGPINQQIVDERILPLVQQLEAES